MYQFSYGRVVADSNTEARARERLAFDRLLGLIAQALEDGSEASRSKACDYAEAFWRFLMLDLANDGNALPEALRASLLSIGLWVLRETERARSGDIETLRAMYDINEIIRDGLSEAP